MSAAVVAKDQTERAEANLELAQRTPNASGPLQPKAMRRTNSLTRPKSRSATPKHRFSKTRSRRAWAARAVDADAAAVTTVSARKAALAIAPRAIEDTTVRAFHAGRVVGPTVLSGEMVAPSQPLFTLIHTDEWFAVANFRETDLAALAIGNCVTVYSMNDHHTPLRGNVKGGAGVLDTERVSLPRLLPYDNTKQQRKSAQVAAT